MAKSQEEEEEPYSFAVTLALNVPQETSIFGEFLIGVYKGFLIQGEKILEQLNSISFKEFLEISNAFKLSGTLLVLQRFFMVVSEVHKKCVADEVARSGKGFLRQLFMAGSKLSESGDHDSALVSAILKQHSLLSQWLQYSKDLTHELGRFEILTDLLLVLEKLAMASNPNKVEVITTISLLNTVKVCLHDGNDTSLTCSQIIKSIEPFLHSSNIRLRIVSKVAMNRLCPYHTVTRNLQVDEFEFIRHEICAERSDALSVYDHLSTADLVALLMMYAHYPDNCRVMLEQDISEILTNLMDTGTEVEQILVAELASLMLSDTGNTPINSSSNPELPLSQDLGDTVEGSQTCIEDLRTRDKRIIQSRSKNPQTCDEGSIGTISMDLQNCDKELNGVSSKDPITCDEGSIKGISDDLLTYDERSIEAVSNDPQSSDMGSVKLVSKDPQSGDRGIKQANRDHHTPAISKCPQIYDEGIVEAACKDILSCDDGAVEIIKKDPHACDEGSLANASKDPQIIEPDIKGSQSCDDEEDSQSVHDELVEVVNKDPHSSQEGSVEAVNNDPLKCGEVSVETVRMDPQNYDEGSVEAISILLHEVAKLMQVYISHPSYHDPIYMVSVCVSLMCGLTGHSDIATITRISENIAQSYELVNTCCEMLKYYPDMPPLPSAAISGILHQCLMHWTTLSDSLCEKLAESGMVLYLTGELEFLQTSVELNEYVVKCLEMSLYILLNCIRIKEIVPAFEFADSKTALIPLTSCTHLSIKIKAKSILSFLSCYMDEANMKAMELDDEEIAFILQNLPLDTTAQLHTTDFDHWFQILRNFGKIKENAGLLSTSEVFKLISNLLTQELESIQELILELLWDLSSSKAVKRIINDQHLDIMRSLENLQSHTKSSLQLLAFCVLWNLEKSNPIDHPACLKYANTCYCYGKYKECVWWCDHLRQASCKEGIMNSAKLLKGKALYCCSQDKLLPFLSMKSTIDPVHEFPKLMNECLAEMKESILLLGTANDHNFLDDDGSKLLDWAMIDFIREANKLDTCSRCLLCRRKTSLKRSHIYPRSVLKEIANSFISEGEHRIFLHELKGKLSMKSAGEITYWMFCSICEERFSQNGENEFRKEFFSPIFQASQQAGLSCKDDHTLSQSILLDIDYGQWLYNFCIGILFRGLGISVMPHCRNNKKIYNAFLSFREHILSLPVKMKPIQKSKQRDISKLKADCGSPQDCLMNLKVKPIPVVILINPTSDDLTNSLEEMPFLPSTLLNSSSSGLASLKLDGGQTFTLDAPFFFIRLGLINFLVEFEGTKNAIFDEKYYVNREGGAYSVPSEKKRWGSIPAGLQEIFQSLSYDNQATNLAHLLRLASDQQLLKYTFEDEHSAIKQSNTSADMPLLSVPASPPKDGALELELSIDIDKESSHCSLEHTEASQFLELCLSDLQFSGGKTQINLLPKGFSFFDQMGCLTYGSIHLPESHQILLHATDPALNVTVFLCAGAGAKFSPDCPYLIILLAQEGIIVIDGIILNPGGGIAGFVSDYERRSGTIHPIRTKMMPMIQAAVDIILPNMLIENHFKNLDTVIHWTKCHWSLQEFPTLDIKCMGSGCWYCCNLCNICMQPSKVGLNKQVIGNLLKFCGTRCLAVTNEEDPDTTIPISVATPAQNSFGSKHLISDYTFNLKFHAKNIACTHLARNTLVSMSLFAEKCTTGIELFALQQLRTVDRQVVLGFSISKDMLILEPLTCYMGNEDVQASFAKVKQDSYSKLIIEDAIKLGLGLRDIKDFIEQQEELAE